MKMYAWDAWLLFSFGGRCRRRRWSVPIWHMQNQRNLMFEQLNK